ncbi:hypothetical protein P3T25_006826 [Paraburkholderia sp. GAS32]
MCAASRHARADFPLRLAGNVTLPYRFGSGKYKSHWPRRRKKALFPRGNRAGQDGGVVQARGCLPTFITTTDYQSCCYLNCYCATALLLCCGIAVLLYGGIALRRYCFTAVLRYCVTARFLAINIASLQPPAEPCAWLLRLRTICIASTSYCFTALPRWSNAANCHQRYGSKQRGGRPRRWAR